MKVNTQWLAEWVNLKINTESLAHQLTMVGLEVDALAPVSESTLDNIVIGQVTSMEAHPDADKLRVCRVDVGDKKPLNIVCGAANVVVQGKYPVAMIGAKLPDGLKIKPAKLRGVASEGMLCSSKELGLSESADGLFTLPDDAGVGESVYAYLQLDDTTIEFGLTPNRGDCLSVVGIAREISVLTGAKLKSQAVKPVKATCQDVLPVELKAKGACARYVGRVIKGVNVDVTTPMWMRERLRRCGLRSISPIVDVTNYVMLELGQPLHAFDLHKIAGGIVVRFAKKDESLILLDGQKIKLSEDSLVIADHQGPVALAGIMGGNNSAVSTDSRDIFLESAYFDPLSIAGKARQMGLHTDSSHRFERGVDPELQVKAIERATSLILDIVGGKPGPLIEQVAKADLPVAPRIDFRADQIKRILGVDIPRDRVYQILHQLGLKVEETKTGWTVVPPGFRFDISKEIDLIEEVARIFGYHNIPETNPIIAAAITPEPEDQIKLNEIKALLVARGFQEAITYSFVDPKMQSLITPELESIAVENPISADMSVMRTSLLPGLLQAAIYNNNRQQDRIRLFESGLVFQQKDNHIEQTEHLGGLIMGDTRHEQWGEEAKKADFFDAKNVVEALLGLTRQSECFQFKADNHPAMHPGQTAGVHFTDKNGTDHHVGWLGTLYPALQTQLGLNERVLVFELQLDLLTNRRVPSYAELSKFPTIRRDLAIVVDDSVSFHDVSACVKKTATELLKNFQLFDEYTGKGIDSGRKSLAFGITLQNHARTLKDEEIDTIIARVIKSLELELGATLRE